MGFFFDRVKSHANTRLIIDFLSHCHSGHAFEAVIGASFPKPSSLVSWSQICLLNSIAVFDTVRSY